MARALSQMSWEWVQPQLPLRSVTLAKERAISTFLTPQILILKFHNHSLGFGPTIQSFQRLRHPTPLPLGGLVHGRDSYARVLAHHHLSRSDNEMPNLIWIQAISSFFALEGGANLIYWYLYGGGVADNNFWQVGRALRLILGLALVIFG